MIRERIDGFMIAKDNEIQGVTDDVNALIEYLNESLRSR